MSAVILNFSRYVLFLLMAVIYWPVVLAAQDTASNQTSNTEKEQAVLEGQDEYVTLQILEAGQMPKAKITSITEKGKDIGMDKMYLTGFIKSEPYDALQNKLIISWQLAEMSGRTDRLEEPFLSSILSDGELEEGAIFNAKGDKKKLLALFERLNLRVQQEQTNKEAAQKVADVLTDKGVAASGGSSQTGVKNPEFLARGPKFEVEQDAEVVTERCGFEENINNEEVVIKQRAVQDGKEVASCAANPLATIKLHREYSTCDMDEDFDKEQVTPAYKLKWTDPDSGVVNYASDGKCFPDIDKASQFVYSDEGCGLKPDFVAGKSWQLVKIQYFDNGVPKLLRDCSVIEEKSQEYEHIATTDGCDPLVVDGKVTIFSRKYIEIDGVRQEVADCAPQQGQVEVITESCNSYAHDFTAATSYELVSYYYMDDGVKKLVSGQNCVRAENGLSHFTDSSGCDVIHDDASLQSHYYARKFITKDNSPTSADRIYISECAQNGVPVKYILTGKKWAMPNVTARDVKLEYSHDSGYCKDGGVIQTPWRVVSGGAVLDSSISSQSPENVIYEIIYQWHCGGWSPTVGSCSSLSSACSPPPSLVPYCTSYLNYLKSTIMSCINPICRNQSVIYAYHLYERLDGSNYEDRSAVADVRYFCGVETSLSGQIE